MSNILNNTTSLQAILNTINELPEAGKGNDPFASTPLFTYTVDAISGAQYGFVKNSSGYYESQNKGQNSSYAICRVNLTVTSTCDIVFDVINYAETTYDYAVFSILDNALDLNNSADSDAKENFNNRQSANIVNVTYNNVPIGSHFIDIKFIKDGSQNVNNDSVQFKLQEQGEGLSQETINKILAADTDLKAENIKSGVDIFGVVGSYVGSGDTSGEDGLIAGTLSSYTNNRVTNIGQAAFAYNPFLTSVSFPAVITIGISAFLSCSKLTTITFPVATTISGSAFQNCSKLTAASFPLATLVANSAFYNCYSLSSINFPLVTSISNAAFQACS